MRMGRRQHRGFCIIFLLSNYLWQTHSLDTSKDSRRSGSLWLSKCPSGLPIKSITRWVYYRCTQSVSKRDTSPLSPPPIWNVPRPSTS
ncbi:hypothetical protein DL95DRAFT_72733 [Leptodontidium sp. 2 PMI_412]|nr:hypothetical protein DL95DRAFT_72733 [Leptodontidium sp. 2 PMI_412]